MMETLDARQKIIIIPLMVSAVLVTVGIIIGDIPILGNLIIISVFVSVVPYFLLKYSQLLWLKGVEDQFPNFVRDLADSSRSGMSLTECIGIAAKANYRKLSPEIQ